MSEDLIDGVFKILKDKFYNEIVPSIESFQNNKSWGDIKIEMEINFKDGQIKRVTPGCSTQNHVRANDENR